MGVGEELFERKTADMTGMIYQPSTVVEHIKNNMFTAVDDIMQRDLGKTWRTQDTVNKDFAKMTMQESVAEQDEDMQKTDGMKKTSFDTDDTSLFQQDLLKTHGDPVGSGKVWDQPMGSHDVDRGHTVQCDVLEQPDSQPMGSHEDVRDTVGSPVSEEPASHMSDVNHTAQTEKDKQTTVNQTVMSEVKIQEAASDVNRVECVPVEDECITHGYTPVDTHDSPATSEETFQTFAYSGDFLESEDNPDIYLADTVLICDSDPQLPYITEHSYNQAVSKLTNKVRWKVGFSPEDYRLLVAVVGKLPPEPTQRNLEIVSTIYGIVEELMSKESAIGDCSRNWLQDFLEGKDTTHVGYDKAVKKFENQVSMCEELTKDAKTSVQVVDGNKQTTCLSQNIPVICIPRGDPSKSKLAGRHGIHREHCLRKASKTYNKKKTRKSMKFRRRSKSHSLTPGIVGLLPPCLGQITYTNVEGVKDYLYRLKPKEGFMFQSGAICKKGLLSAGQYTFEEGHHYDVIKTCGKGAFGRAVHCQLKCTDTEFISKQVAKKERFNILEVIVPLDNPHDNIVKIFGFIDRPTGYEIIMEYAGHPLDVVVLRRQLGDEEKSDIFHQMLDAVAYLHRRYVYHRDLKPQNIAIKKLDSGGLKATLIDFGASITDRSPPNVREMTPAYIPWELCGRLLCSVNVPIRWELVDGHALGCVLVFMECARHVWTDVIERNRRNGQPDRALLKHICDHPEDIKYEVYNKCSGSFVNIALALTEPETEHRMTPMDVMDKVHFINGVLHLRAQCLGVALPDITAGSANIIGEIPDFENLLQ